MFRSRDVSLTCVISDNSKLNEGLNTLGSSVPTAEVCSQTYDVGRGRKEWKGQKPQRVPTCSDLRTGCLSKDKNKNTASCPNEKSGNAIYFWYFVTAF